MIRKHTLLRAGLGSLMLAFLLSCGGGSEVGGGSVSGYYTGDGVTLGGSSGGDGTGGDGASGGGTSAGGDGGGSTSTAGNGADDGSGVGSGGTGVSANAGSAVGSVDGMGSIIVGGVRYNIDQVPAGMVDLRDASEWQLGMTVEVTGPVDAGFTTGTATRLKSMAQMRGTVDAVDAAAGTFGLLGSTVGVDDETVWADLPGLAGLTMGTRVQVWALPVAPGLLRATRIETQPVGVSTVVTGMIEALDTASSTFRLGSLVVGYGAASLPADGLADGRIVRVEAALAPAGGVLQADKVEAGYALSKEKDAAVKLEGVITDFAAKASPFKLMGVTIDGSTAAVTGGQDGNLSNGVRVVASGVLSPAGVLVASKIKIRHVPGGGALPVYYDIHGVIDNYVSPSSLRVRGANGVQRVDITAALPTISGTGELKDGQKVRVQGSRVIAGVLQVTQLTYE